MKTVRKLFAEKCDQWARFDRGYWILLGIGGAYFALICTLEHFGVK